jgi:hypothetical protein
MKDKRLMHTRKFPALFRQRGASLLEGIAYLGIAALIILGAVSLLTTAFGSAQNNSTETQTTSIRTATRKLYQTQVAGYGVLGADMTPTLINSGVFPPSMINTAGTGVINAWNGAVTVAVDATLVTQFVVTYTLVPKQNCIDMFANGGTANGWVAVKATTGGYDTAPTPLAANTACSAALNTVSLKSV